VGLILDTHVLIRAERGRQSVDFSRWSEHGDAYISAITASELLVGVHRADSEARRIRRSAFVEAVLGTIPVVDFDLEAARIHARVMAGLAARGELLGPHDLIIAATALSRGFALMTGNLKGSQRVPGLVLVPLD
jgi:predicted nucleic acid-binding protein